MKYKKNYYANWLVKLMDFLRFRPLRVIALIITGIPVIIYGIFGLMYENLIKSGDLKYLFTQAIEVFEDVWNWE